MKPRTTPSDILKQYNTDTFLENIKSNNAKTFAKMGHQLLTDPVYIQIFFEKLEQAYLEEKLSKQDIMDFFAKRNKRNYNLMQNIIMQKICLKDASKVYGVFLNSLKRNLLDNNIITKADFCYLLLQTDKGRLSSYRLILFYPNLNTSWRKRVITVMSTIINNVLNEKELIHNVLETMSSVLKYSVKLNGVYKQLLRNYFILLLKADDEYILKMKPLLVNKQSIFTIPVLKKLYETFLFRCDQIQSSPLVENIYGDEAEERSLVENIYTDPIGEKPLVQNIYNDVTEAKSLVENGNAEEKYSAELKLNDYLINKIACVPYGHSYFSHILDQEYNPLLENKDAKKLSDFELPKYTGLPYLLFAASQAKGNSIKEIEFIPETVLDRYTNGT